MAIAESGGTRLVSRNQKKVLLLPGNFPDTVERKKGEMKNKNLNMDIYSTHKFIMSQYVWVSTLDTLKVYLISLLFWPHQAA